MLDSEDFEQIRRIVKEELAQALPQPTSAAIRQKRYRENLKAKRNAVTPETALRNGRYASPSENGVTDHNAPVTPLRSNGEKEEKERSKEREESFLFSLPVTKEKKKREGGVGGKPVLMNNEVLEELQQNPAYQGIDLTKEAFKYNEWCDRNKKPQTVRRFVNWINRIV